MLGFYRMELAAIGGSSRRMRLLVLLLVLMAELAEPLLAPLEFLALQSMKKNLHDMPGSNYLSAWDFSKDPCKFPGILCSSSEPQRITTLNLGDPAAGAPGLRGKLHGALGLLSSLVEFTVAPGQLVGPIPATIAQLGELQFLGISRNFLSGSIPAGISALKKLETLDLSYNQLSGSIPQGIGQLPQLTNLILARNKLTGPLPNLSGTSSLLRLDLKQNALSGTLPSLPSSLKYLALSNNQLSGGIQNVGHLSSLTYIDLSFNKFTGIIPSSLLGFHINSLHLQRNSLSGPVQPSAAVNIPTVDLSYNALNGPISPFFASVQTLYLNNNRFSGAVPRDFADNLLSAQIQVLYLQHNYLTQISIKPSAKLPISTSLCIQYNCMVPPIVSPCPSNAGKQQKRPSYQCK
ncbi:hypothetical protein SUGI_0063310 [Cryptomeria japonica]|uniref:receptor kinase-like protein Xa21 n=1 Tax=Cryptomeria japonica TaxID=3369 RepID=UPI0024089F91|nr:receptor kinase-like protein Xa21 [Cryptomeria japonica]GLJ07275.1 hypothetical protein SUGI_0063310 [Cryptomeria japonica]